MNVDDAAVVEMNQLVLPSPLHASHSRAMQLAKCRLTRASSEGRMK